MVYSLVHDARRQKGHGRFRTACFTAGVTGLYVGNQKGTLVSTPQAELTLIFEGIEGDSHAGFTRKADARVRHFPRGTLIRNERQISLVAVEELAEIAAKLDLPQVLPEWLGANFAIQDIPALTQLAPATRLFFEGGAVIVVTTENVPCMGPGRVIQTQYAERAGLASRFVKAAFHKRGLLAVVEKPGIVHAGEPFTAKPLAALL